MKNGMYSVILNKETDVMYLKPSLRHLQAFALKFNFPQKILHLIWKVISWHLTVYLTLLHITFPRRYFILYGKSYHNTYQYPRYGCEDEYIKYAFFDYPPPLQNWVLEKPPSSQFIFPISSVYTNINYLFFS